MNRRTWIIVACMAGLISMGSLGACFLGQSPTNNPYGWALGLAVICCVGLLVTGFAIRQSRRDDERRR